MCSSEKAHLELGYELGEDAKECLCSGGLAILSKVGGHFEELLHRSGLQGLHGLDCRVTVLQKALQVEDKQLVHIFGYDFVWCRC